MFVSSCWKLVWWCPQQVKILVWFLSLLLQKYSNACLNGLLRSPACSVRSCCTGFRFLDAYEKSLVGRSLLGLLCAIALMQTMGDCSATVVTNNWGRDIFFWYVCSPFIVDCSRHRDRVRRKQQSARGAWDLDMRSVYARGGATMMPAVQLATGPPGWCAEAVVEEAPQCQPQQRLWRDGEFVLKSPHVLLW